MMIQRFVTLVVALASFTGYAESKYSTIDEYFHALKTVPINLSSHGPICEQMARLQMEQIYNNSEYELKVGIVYLNDTRVVGELDLVIFRKSDDEAIAIAEVKCQRRLSSALSHAKSQLQRFTHSIARDEVKEMHLIDEEDEQFFPTSFDENPARWTIGQKGARAAGFSHELELELDDILKLQKRLQKCQSHGYCD